MTTTTGLPPSPGNHPDAPLRVAATGDQRARHALPTLDDLSWTPGTSAGEKRETLLHQAAQMREHSERLSDRAAYVYFLAYADQLESIAELVTDEPDAIGDGEPDNAGPVELNPTQAAVFGAMLRPARALRDRISVGRAFAHGGHRQVNRRVRSTRTTRRTSIARARTCTSRSTASARARSGASGDPDLPGEPEPPGGTRPGRYTYAVLPPEARS